MMQLPSRNGIGPIAIALIDDDPSLRRGVSRLVRSLGFSCTTVDSGEQALANPEVLTSDCLIIDVQLAGMDGFETRDRFRALGIAAPVVFITAHSEYDSPEWVARREGSPCLSKPFDDVELLSAIQRVMGGTDQIS